MNDQQKKQRLQWLEAASLGWMFPIAIGIGFGWGWWMDKMFGTWPWLSAIFSVFGIIAAFVNLFRIGLRDVPRREKSDDRRH